MVMTTIYPLMVCTEKRPQLLPRLCRIQEKSIFPEQNLTSNLHHTEQATAKASRIVDAYQFLQNTKVIFVLKS